MQQLPIIGCALNLSEGRRPDVVDLVTAQASTAAYVLDVSSDPDHNRTVITICGYPAQVVEAALRSASTAVRQLDLTSHSGVHPRMGVLDVVPFYPVRDASMPAAVEAARNCGRRLWEELRVPAFLYDHASGADPPLSLPDVRRLAFTGTLPDFGGAHPHPTAGAVAVGARDLLVAYNVALDTDDVAVARAIASNVRRLNRDRLRALGFYLPSRAAAQVSMNIVDPIRLSLHDAYRAVESAASEAGAGILSSEVVGLVPRACLRDTPLELLKLGEKPKVLEDEVDRLFR